MIRNKFIMNTHKNKTKLASILAIIAVMTFTASNGMINTNDIQAFADDSMLTDEEREALNRESREDAARIRRDKSWVDIKDDWRHGITHDDDSSSSARVKYEKGMASGQYAVAIGDKSWYWYHQTTDLDNCVYCGNWTAMVWGSRGALGADGCAMYSMAMIISNLTNQEVTPSVFLQDIGCEISSDGGTCDTGPSDVLTDHTIVSYANLESTVATKYDLKYTENFDGHTSDEIKSMINDTLNKKGMVWLRYHGGPGRNGWPRFNTSSHFVAIADKVGNEYLILDSCNNPADDTALWVSIDDILTYKYDVIQGWWNENDIWIGGGGFTNGEWYSDASAIGKYKNRTELGTFDGQTFYLYDGLPWEYESGAYAVNTNAALYDLYDYVAEISPSAGVSTAWGHNTADDIINNFSDGKGTWTSVRMSNQPGYDSVTNNFNTYNFSGTSGQHYKVVDGVACIPCGLPVIAIDPNYNVGFGAYDESTNTNYWTKYASAQNGGYGYGSSSQPLRKVAIILRRFSDEKIFYLPAANVDAKAHTFPGGIAQTGITTQKLGWTENPNAVELDSSGNPSRMTEIHAAIDGGGSSRDFYHTISGKDWSYLGELMNSEFYGSDGITAWDCVWNVGELACVPNVVANPIIDSREYQFMGVVCWPV